MTWLNVTEYLTQKYAPFVVITIQPYLHACMTYHRFVTTVTRRVPLVEQEETPYPSEAPEFNPGS